MLKNVSFWKTLNIFEIKESSLCMWGHVWGKKKEDTSTTYFPKTAYWMRLVPNAESVDEPGNKSSEINCTPNFAKVEA